MIYEAKIIIAAIHENFGLDISLRTRRREIVDARQAAQVAMRVMGSTTQIAECFNMNHSSIVHASQAHDDKYHKDSTKRLRHFELYCAVYDFVTELIKEKKFDEFDAILNVREELHHQREKNAEIIELLRSTENELKKSKKQIDELHKFKVAFKQLREKVNETS